MLGHSFFLVARQILSTVDGEKEVKKSAGLRKHLKPSPASQRLVVFVSGR